MISDASRAEAALRTLARKIGRHHPDAAVSAREGLAETVTLNRLGVTPGPSLAGMLAAQHRYRRINGHRQLDDLGRAITATIHQRAELAKVG